MSAKGKHSAPGAGNIYAKANEVIVKITGADTNQTFEVVEENCKPDFQSRAHYHIKAYETFYVFDGSADFQVGDELFHASKGSCVHIPPGVPHQVTSQHGVHMLMIYSPAGTEGMFADMHALTQEQLMNAEFTRQLLFQLVEQLEVPSLDDVGDFAGHVFADSRQLRKVGAFRQHASHALWQAIDGARRAVIGAHTKLVLALDIQKVGGLIEHRCDFGVLYRHRS